MAQKKVAQTLRLFYYLLSPSLIQQKPLLSPEPNLSFLNCWIGERVVASSEVEQHAERAMFAGTVEVTPS